MRFGWRFHRRFDMHFLGRHCYMKSPKKAPKTDHKHVHVNVARLGAFEGDLYSSRINSQNRQKIQSYSVQWPLFPCEHFDGMRKTPNAHWEIAQWLGSLPSCCRFVSSNPEGALCMGNTWISPILQMLTSLILFMFEKGMCISKLLI